MHRVIEYILFRAVLHHAAEIHYADLVGNMFYDGKIVRNEYIGKIVVYLQRFKQIDYLCLYRYVERGNRFVANNEFRIQRERARDTYTLALTAGKFVRVALVIMRLKSAFLHYVENVIF